MTFLYTLQIIPLSNGTTFSLCPHFQCTCPALLAFHCCHKFCTLQTSKKYNFFLCPNFHCKFGIQLMLQLQWIYSVLLYFLCTFTVFWQYIFAVYYWKKNLLLLGGLSSIIHCSNFFQRFWQFFFPISNKIYRRFLLFADLGGMAPAVRRNEIKSAWPHRHA